MKNTNNFKKHFKHYLTSFITISLSILLTITLSSCKKKNETIENPIALGYIDGVGYIINTEGKQLSLSNFDEVKPFYGDFLMVRKNNLWGYIKNNGEIVTDCIYDEVYPMSENKAVVKEKGKYKIIDAFGNSLYIFNNGIFSNSYFNENMLVIEKDQLLGYLKYDENTNSVSILIEPCFDYAGNFSEGYACIGMVTDGYIKYSYLNTLGQNIYGNFIFDEANDVSCARAKVGFNIIVNTYYQYLVLPTEQTNDIKEPEYLKSKVNDKVIRYQYASDFYNNMAFVANYENYIYGDEESNTLYYKDFSFVDTLGNFDYEEGVDDIGKAVPKNFYPYSPFFLNDVLIFINATRSIPVCKFFRETSYKQDDGDGGYNIIHEFKEASFNFDEENIIVKKLMEDNKWTYRMASSYLTQPYELKMVKWISELNTYTTIAKISNNKYSIVKIVSTKIPDEEKTDRNLDEYNITLEYIVPVIYDNIIY